MGAPADEHVTAGVDGVVVQSGLVEDRGGTVDRPALDEARRVQRHSADVEVATRLPAELIATFEHFAHLRIRIRKGKLAAVEAADLTVLLVGAERGVDPTQPVEHPREDRFVGLVANVDDDRHAHDVLDAPNTGQSLEDGGHARFAFRIAACNDCANASLV